jgi:hypothetical protein
MSNIDNSYAVKLASYLGHVNGLRVKQAFLEGMDPTAQAALLAGGAGAAVGGVGNALFGKRKKGVGMLGRLGRGALAGGGIGAGLGAGINEGAIRLGMGRTGADRDMYLSGHVNNASDYITPPVDYAKSMLSNLLSKKLPPMTDIVSSIENNKGDRMESESDQGRKSREDQEAMGYDPLKAMDILRSKATNPGFNSGISDFGNRVY